MPRKSLSSFDLKRLVGELSFLDKGVVRGVKSRKNELYILIFKGGEYWLRIVPGRYVSVSRNKPEGTSDYPFTSKVKNALSGKRVSITMHGSDRIIELVAGDIRLVSELFSNGNVSLMKDDEIEMSMFTRKYGSRTVASGEKYVYPEGKPDVFSVGYDEFANTLSNSDKENVVKAIAVDLSIGGLYAEELCYRAGVPKETRLDELHAEETRNLFDRFEEMLSEPEKPCVMGGQTLAVVEIRHTDTPREFFSDINSAVTALFREAVTPSESGGDDRLERINSAIEKYGHVLSYINDNYQQVQDAIDTARDSKTALGRRRDTLTNEGWVLTGKLLTRKDGPEVKVDITVPLRKTISSYYDRIKKLKEDASRRKRSAPKLRKLPFVREEAWYLKFRWSVTRNGCTIIIGKDSGQNASLLSKHAEKGDKILHADVFGSPFGVIKPGASGTITERDLEEGAALVASYSSAWKAGAANIDVYYVETSQVKKGAPSGEFLKKGAFYIEGKRQYLKSVQLGLYVSLSVSDEGYGLSVTAHRPEGTFVLVRPGSRKRDEVVKKIIKTFADESGVLVEKDRLDKLLPPGNAVLPKENGFWR